MLYLFSICYILFSIHLLYSIFVFLYFTIFYFTILYFVFHIWWFKFLKVLCRRDLWLFFIHFKQVKYFLDIFRIDKVSMNLFRTEILPKPGKCPCHPSCRENLFVPIFTNPSMMNKKNETSIATGFITVLPNVDILHEIITHRHRILS